MSTIDRVRYYDGEFLRAFDFSDEQTYHLEMRRRLNRDLHLYGIVQGLQLHDDNQAGVHLVSILPGMAIDALGREIYVFAPYTLGDSDLTNNRVSKPGNYDVWLRYSKTPATPPSAGYGVCNQPNQYTRWVESFTVVLLTSPSNPFSLPNFADDDTDNPSQDGVGVLLGRVYIEPSSAIKLFSQPFFDERLSFIGITAQRIKAPYDVPQPFPFQGKNSALSPLTSLDIEPNIFAQQNLILGPDFDLTQTASGTKIAANPTPVTGPGSAKLAGDLFVQGNIYSFLPDAVNPQWLGLTAYVQQLVKASGPDVLTDSQVATIAFPMPASGKGLTSSILLKSTRLNSFSKVVPIAFVSSSTFDPAVSPGSQVTLSIDSVGITPNPPTTNQVTVNASWTALPVNGAGKCAFTTFTIFFVAVCFP